MMHHCNSLYIDNFFRTMALFVIHGSRRNSFLFYDPREIGYPFIKMNVRGTTAYFKCHVKLCPVTGRCTNFTSVVTGDSYGAEFTTSHHHNHPPTPEIALRNAFKEECKVRASEEMTDLRTIYDDVKRR